VRQRSSESVELPHQEDAELSPLGIGEHSIECRSRTFRPAESFIEVFVPNIETATVCKLSKISDLHFGALICEGTDAAIDRGLV
jgi:hypothetical protein